MVTPRVGMKVQDQPGGPKTLYPGANRAEEVAQMTRHNRSGTVEGTEPMELIQTPAVDEVDGVLDELQAWFLGKALREGWVYTSVLRQLVNRMYRDRDYLDRRKREGRHTAYDYAVDRDLKALAWAIRAIVRYTPAEEKARPEPPKPPRKPSRRLSAAERAKTAGRPSWNGQPKHDWAGPDLPPRTPRQGSATQRGLSERAQKARR
jgi:hypothetical protein